MNEAFVVIDLEATDREPANAHIVEVAAIIITPPWFGEGGQRMVSSFIKPPVAIPAETSAVHHIVDADVDGAPTWDEWRPTLAEALAPAGVIAVAHNAGYERELLAKNGIQAHRWLCTYKAACRVWPDAPGLGNETLRYYLGLGTGRRHVQQPHSAPHDAQVTAQILQALLDAGTPIDDMVAWTEQPAMLPTCPIGEWRGKKWSEVDYGFLDWILRKIHDREDVRFCAKAELERRAAAARAPVEEEDEVPF